MACQTITIDAPGVDPLILSDGLDQASDTVTWGWEKKEGWDGTPPVRLAVLETETPQVTSSTRDARTIEINGFALTPTPALYYAALNLLEDLGDALIDATYTTPATLTIDSDTAAAVWLNDGSQITYQLLGELLGFTFTIELYMPDPAKV